MSETFEAIWLGHESFQFIVTDNWNDDTKLMDNFSNLGSSLCDWTEMYLETFFMHLHFLKIVPDGIIC